MRREVHVSEEGIEAPAPTDEDYYGGGGGISIDGGLTFPRMMGGKKPRPVPDHLENTQALLGYYGVLVRYNLMTHCAETTIPGIRGCQELREDAALAWIANRAAEAKLSRTAIPSHLAELRRLSEYHPVFEWMMSKAWDGQSRFEDLLDSLDLAKEQDRAVSRFLLRRWLIYAAKAWDAKGWPEVQSQGVLVLQGPQGKCKTRWLQRLLPAERGWMATGRLLRPDDRDSVQQACAFALTELGELDATFRKADIAALKQFITEKTDTYRIPYGKAFANHRRSTVFCASVNGAEYLADTTGNRRFWTIAVDFCDAGHCIDMQQVFAEAHVYAARGERHWLDDAEADALERSNLRFEPTDPLQQYVTETWEPCPGGRHVPLTEIWEALPPFRTGQRLPSRSEVDTVSRALRAMGAEASRSKLGRGYRVQKVSSMTLEHFDRAFA